MKCLTLLALLLCLLSVPPVASHEPELPDAHQPRKRFEQWRRQAAAPSPAGRREAAHALGRFGRRALPTLLRLLRDRDGGVRLAAVKSVRMIVSGQTPLTGYDPAVPGLALEPVDGARRPTWTGERYRRLLGDYRGELRARLDGLQKEGPEVRALARQTLHQLEVRLAITRLSLQEGEGKPVTAHPGGKVEVKGDELRSARGERLAVLTDGPQQPVSCWAFSRDGRLLAVGQTYDGSREDPHDYTVRGYLRLYDAATGEQLGEGGGLFGPVTDLAFSGDGKEVLYRTGQYKEVGGK